MNTKILFVCTAALAFTQTAYGMGHKKMNVAEVKGVTETQLAHSEKEKTLSIMVRGRAAELLYRTLDERRVEQISSPALEMTGSLSNSHWTVRGKQVSCSRIHSAKTKKDDYACAFELDPRGEVAGKVEPFNPVVFNLPRTNTQARLFKAPKSGGRSLASATSPMPHPAKAYVMYDVKKQPGRAQRNYEDAMIVFRGKAAAQIMDFLSESKKYREFVLGGAKGVKGKEISCLEAKGAEPERCALVVSLETGGISTMKNPLFR